MAWYIECPVDLTTLVNANKLTLQNAFVAHTAEHAWSPADATKYFTANCWEGPVTVRPVGPVGPAGR